MQQLTFFNTIELNGEALAQAVQACSRQEDRILTIMDAGIAYTPFEIHRLYNKLFPEVPITSIRRAITCLTEKGYLVKTKDMRLGAYGINNHCWSKK